MSEAGAGPARAHARARLIVGALAMALAASSIPLGFVMDDYGLRAALHSPGERAPAAYDLYRFLTGDPAINAVLIKGGFLPWWSSPELRLHFLRPLSSLLFALDDHLFGSAPLGYHLMSLAWYLALLLGVARLLSKVLAPLGATLGFAAFALSSAQVEPVAWISARHVLVAATLGTAALVARSTRHRRWLAPLLFVLALAGSEAALGIVPLWIALVMRDESGLQRERVKELAPVLGITAVYLLLYGLLDYGVRNSGSYHDPFTDPVGFLAIALTRVPTLLGDAALGIPVTLSYVVAAPELALAGVAAMGFVYLAWRSAGCPAIGWLVAAGVLGVTLGATGYPSGRMLVIPNLAFAAAFGAIAERWSTTGTVARVLIAVLAVAHLAIEPVQMLSGITALKRGARFTEANAREEIALAPPSGNLVLVASPNPLVFLYPPGIARELAPHRIRCSSVLSAARSAHRLTRVSERGFTLEATEHPLLDGSFDMLFRAPNEPFAVGDTVSQCGLDIEVQAVDAGRPTKLSIEAPSSLDGPEWRFLIWRDGHLVPLTFPAIGAVIELEGSLDSEARVRPSSTLR